jgi:hypothetical protein
MITVETFGYLASATVALSLMLKDLRWLRGLNGVGAGMFVAYGAMIRSTPVVVLNAFIAVADFYYLAKLLREPRAEASPVLAAGARGE